jgi:probable phosphoglycerate mutase
MQQIPHITPRRFVYVRHGQTDWNLENRTQGSADITLNAMGRKQAADSARAIQLSGWAIVRICCSPLVRAKETAHIIASVLGLPVCITHELREACFGEQEGLAKGAWLRAWREGVDPIGAEPYAHFLQRVAVGLNKALEGPQEVLIVAHLAVYWAIEEALGYPPGPETSNGVPLLHTPHATNAEAWTIVGL